VAHNLYYSFSARQNLATVDATLNRCKDIVGLINALGDVQPYDHNLPIGWQWRPTMEAGYCYRNVARLEESGKLMNEAIQIARDIKDDNSRLAQLRLVIIELVNIHYERVEVLNLANEMLATASSLDTGIAKDIRESIPRLIANRVNY
jgi:hypothetical protein